MTRSTLIALLLLALPALADSCKDPDVCPARTGNNATVIVPPVVAARLEGETLRAVGIVGCVGEAAIPDNGGFSLTVWGDNLQTEQYDGLIEDEQFILVAEDTLDVALQEQIPARLDLLEYMPNAIYVLR